MRRRIIVVTLSDFGVIYQDVFIDSKPACERMIFWTKQIAEEFDMPLKEFLEIEMDIRNNCYYGSKEALNFDLGKYNIDYREFYIEI